LATFAASSILNDALIYLDNNRIESIFNGVTRVGLTQAA
jgi:hypothetical protein